MESISRDHTRSFAVEAVTECRAAPDSAKVHGRSGAGLTR
jgi:hypothetical protein